VRVDGFAELLVALLRLGATGRNSQADLGKAGTLGLVDAEEAPGVGECLVPTNARSDAR